jgi:nitrate/nitrite transport system ATP-binding protein
MLNSKGRQHATVSRKLILPDIEPEDLSAPKTLFKRRPTRQSEVKRETVEVDL